MHVSLNIAYFTSMFHSTCISHIKDVLACHACLNFFLFEMFYCIGHVQSLKSDVLLNSLKTTNRISSRKSASLGYILYITYS